LSFLVLLAVLFGSTGAPALAHSGTDNLMRACEVIDVHENDSPPTQSAFKKQNGEPDGGTVPPSAYHHHCACALKADTFTPIFGAFRNAEIFSSSLVTAMASHLTAPLTEPPAA
jgi:hypothetical protein